MQGGSIAIRYGLKYHVQFKPFKSKVHWPLLNVHLIRLSSDGNELICEGLFSHPNEIWELASSPFDQWIFSAVFSSEEEKEQVLEVDEKIMEGDIGKEKEFAHKIVKITLVTEGKSRETEGKVSTSRSSSLNLSFLDSRESLQFLHLEKNLS